MYRTKKAAAAMYGWDCPLRTFTSPGFDCDPVGDPAAVNKSIIGSKKFNTSPRPYVCCCHPPSTQRIQNRWVKKGSLLLFSRSRPRGRQVLQGTPQRRSPTHLGRFWLDKRTSGGSGDMGDSLGAISHIKLSQGAFRGNPPIFLVPCISASWFC